MNRLKEILRIINGSPNPVAVYQTYRNEIKRLLQDMQAHLSDDYGAKGVRAPLQTKDIKLSARIYGKTEQPQEMTPEAAISQAWGYFLSPRTR